MATWDESKRRANLAKHGLDFVDAEAIFSSNSFSPEAIRAMIDAAPEAVPFDADSPPTRPEEWAEAIFVPGGGYPAVKAALEQRRRTRGQQKTPKKVPTTIRFDPDVLDGLRATGKGWQTRVNQAMREWLRQR